MKEGSTMPTRKSWLPRMAHVAFALGLLGFAVMSLDLFGFMVRKTVIACDELAEGSKIEISGDFQCERRGLFARDNYVLFKSGEGKVLNRVLIKPLDFGPGVGTRVEFVAYGDGHSAYSIDEAGTKKFLLGSLGSVTNWTNNGMSRITAILPYGHPGILLAHGAAATDKQMLLGHFRFEPTNETSLAVTNRKDAEVGTSVVFTFFSTLFLAGLVGLITTYRERPIVYILGLIGALYFVTLVAGTPFGTQVGGIPVGDDLSYFSWASAIGYHLNPDLTMQSIDSWARGSNHHTWGTGVLLAPSLMLQKLVLPSTMGFSSVTYSLVSYNSMLLTFLSVLIYYFAFVQVFPRHVAMVISLGTLTCTSLLKWTYLRNVFSHSAEAFTIAWFTYCFIRQYFTKQGSMINRLWLFFAIIAVAQVRRENVLFGLLPAYFELALFGKSHIKHALFFCAATVSSWLVLQATNLWTFAPGFFYTSTARHLGFNNIPQLMRDNFFNITFNSETGLWALWNIPAYLAVLASLHARRNLKIIAPLSVMVAGYVFMCIIHEFPTGFDWQNRFLIKLNPIIFAAVGYLLTVPTFKSFRPLIYAGILFTSVVETFFLYPREIPPGLPTYANIFSDLQLSEPQDLFLFRTLFFLPVICFGVITLLGYGILVRRVLRQRFF